MNTASDEKPGALYWSLVKPVWISLNSSWDDTNDGQRFVREYGAVRTEIGHLYAGHWCQSEVCNGGFWQFFHNTTGILAPEALAAYRAVGISEWANLVEKSMAFFGATYPRDRSRRHEILSGLVKTGERKEWDPFYELDDRFYRWLDAQPDRWDRIADDYAKRVTGALGSR